jgi:hypothetical protein
VRSISLTADDAVLRRSSELLDELRSTFDKCRFDDHLVEAGRVRTLKPGPVRVVGVSENRDVGPGVDDFFGLHAGNVRDHEIRRVDAVARDKSMALKQALQLPTEEEIDPDEQDRRHEIDPSSPRGRG